MWVFFFFFFNGHYCLQVSFSCSADFPSSVFLQEVDQVDQVGPTARLCPSLYWLSWASHAAFMSKHSPPDWTQQLITLIWHLKHALLNPSLTVQPYQHFITPASCTSVWTWIDQLPFLLFIVFLGCYSWDLIWGCLAAHVVGKWFDRSVLDAELLGIYTSDWISGWLWVPLLSGCRTDYQILSSQLGVVRLCPVTSVPMLVS